MGSLMIPPVVLSRCDRIGDLLLSLPSLALLAKAGFQKRLLHCSPYAEAVGEWALFNGLCEELWAPDFSKEMIAPQGWEEAVGLCLHFSKSSVQGFKALRLKKTYGPRTKLAALWSFNRTLAQHRSRVEKSEMEYNLDLVRFLLAQMDLPQAEFTGLPALKVPPQWKSPRPSPHLIVVVANRGSALNWPVSKYFEAALVAKAEGKTIEFLVSGLDAEARKLELSRLGAETHGMPIVGDFSNLRELIVYIAGARELLSSSTGPLHVAFAAGVEVTGLFPTQRVQSFRRWQPAGYWHSAPLRFIDIG